MRCPVCNQPVGESAWLLNHHRRLRKGACGEVQILQRQPTEPTPEIVAYEHDRARRTAHELHTGNRKGPFKRLLRAKKRK